MSKKTKKVVRSKITCITCGDTKGCRPDVFDKRAEKAGGVDELLASYQCRGCRKGDEASTATKTTTTAKKKAKVKDLQPEADVAAFMAPEAEAETVEA
jgi:hypothetical protein